MTYQELRKLFYTHEDKDPSTHLTAYITFSGFGSQNQKTYPWESRTYAISSNNKAYQPEKGGYSIYGSCLDGTDCGIRLEKYMRDEQGGKDGWTVEDCCLIGYMPVIHDSGLLLPRLFYTYDEAMRAFPYNLENESGRQTVQRVLFYDPLNIRFEERRAA
jgi:hypothetical protein